ncbi:MAG: NAD-binding protein [Armatimonadota bacterium]|nr:NAD-binding protein [Armatimonadota bacterium]
MKIINQLIVGLTIEAVEALTLAEQCGIEPGLVQQALRAGVADSKIPQIHGTRMIRRAYVPGGRAATQLKRPSHGTGAGDAGWGQAAAPRKGGGALPGASVLS